MSKNHGYHKNMRNILKTTKKLNKSLNLKYFKTLKIGKTVDLKINPSLKKGILNKWYCGKSGQLINITNNTCVVRITKRIKNKKIIKIIYVNKKNVSNSRNKINTKIVNLFYNVYKSKFLTDRIKLHKIKHDL